MYGIKEIIVAARRIEEFKSKFPELITDKVKLISLDISNCKSIPEADLIVHAASSTDARDYQYDPFDTTTNIEKSTVNFCEIITKKHIQSKIVFCSSGAVYGQQPSDIEALDENFPFQDVTSLIGYKRAYAQTKRKSESELIELGRSGFNVSIARCFSFSGKYLPKDQHFAHGNFISDAENGRTIEVKTRALVYRSYMDADDLVHSLIGVGLSSNPSCPIFNVGSDNAIELRELARQIGEKYGVPVSLSEITEDKIDRYIPNVNKLKNKLFKINSMNLE
jgi:nucleoside-diphosphate-sugar epimerase